MSRGPHVESPAARSGSFCRAVAPAVFAHIGVIAAFADAGIVDRSFAWLQHGRFRRRNGRAGLDSDQIRAVCRSELVERSPFNDWTLPRVALTRTRRAEAMLRRVFGETQVEELARPLYTVSADLVCQRDCHPPHGAATSRRVGISMSIPGLVPPVGKEGRLLVDGGVLNNLPVDAMHELAEGPDRRRRRRPRHERNDGESPPIPSIMETMARSTILGSGERSERNRKLATLVISPAAQDIGLREFKAPRPRDRSGVRGCERGAFRRRR
jgi:NTE family protein